MEKSSILWAAAGVIALLLLGVGGAALYDEEQDQMESLVQRDLSSITKLKAEQVAAWRLELASDALVLLESPGVSMAARDWLLSPDANRKGELAARLEAIRRAYEYSDLQVIDAAGRIRLSLSGRSGEAGSEERQALAEAVRTGRPALSELHRVEGGGRPVLTTVAALFEGGAERGAVGAILFQVQAEASLFPVVNSWPYPTNSARAQLVRRDGEYVEYLNEWGEGPKTVTPLRVPLTRTENSAVAAVLGKLEAVREEIDHRGIRVFAASAPVRGSSWVLVTKIDHAEGLERWPDRPSVLLAGLLSLMAAVVLAVAFAWQRERKEAYRKLHGVMQERLARERNYHHLLNHIPAGVIAVNGEGRVGFCNNAVCEIFGQPPENLLRRSAGAGPEWEYLRPNGDPMEPEEFPIREVLKTGRPREGFLFGVLAPRSGVPQWVLCSFYPWSDGAGNPLHVLGCFIDVTDLKRTEEALRESEQRLAQAIKAGEIGIFAHDFVTGEEFWSEKMRDQFQVGPDEVLSQELILSRTHPEDRPKGMEQMRQSSDSRGTGVIDIEHRLAYRDGSTRWLRVRGQIYFEGEGAERRAVRSVGACMDITSVKQAVEERERLQNELLQAQKLKSIGRLAGGVAHEYNNLLTVINGYAERLTERLAPDSAERRWALEIGKAGDRAAALATQLLAFGQGQMTRRTRLDLNRIVEDAAKVLSMTIGEDIRLETSLAPDLPPILADHDQVLQMIMTLALNSRDAIEGEGRIEIGTASAEVTAEQAWSHAGLKPGRYATLSVRDTGHGMPPEALEKIFEPFYTTKPVGQGTGLNLASVYGMVQQNGGRIDVRSQVGRGTSFVVYLPASVIDQSIGSFHVEEPMDQQGSQTILVVEDQAALLELAKSMLEMQGYNVLGAESGVKALAVANGFEGEIHLLLTDVMMPGMKGDELCRLLREQRPELKVLYMTGHTEESLAERGLTDSGRECIQKPFRQQALLIKVAEALGARQA